MRDELIAYAIILSEPEPVWDVFDKDIARIVRDWPDIIWC
jgi:hypothetical protein